MPRWELLRQVIRRRRAADESASRTVCCGRCGTLLAHVGQRLSGRCANCGACLERTGRFVDEPPAGRF